MTSIQAADLWIKGLTGLIGLGALLYTVESYRRNSLTKRAEFLIGLHKTFFIDGAFRIMKTLLDSDEAADKTILARKVMQESMDFTDFLNFFELIAYFAESGALDREDADALLGYYLDLLTRNEVVYPYIRKQEKSFENLSRLLANRRQE
jgi:hypothetical protein